MSIQLSIGLSVSRDPLTAAKEALRQAQANLIDEANLAFLFTTPDLTDAAVANLIYPALKGKPPLIGCSSAALLCKNEIFKHGLMLLLLRLPPEAYVYNACVENLSAKSGLSAGVELGEKLLSGFRSNTRRDLGLLFTDGLNTDNTNLALGLQEKLGLSFPLVGASASDNLRYANTYLYFNRQLFSQACAGMLFGGKINFAIGSRHGWKPLGKPRTVTKAKDNIVFEIDGRPAAKLYEDYFTRSRTDLKKELRRLSISYPLGISLPQEQECLLRSIFAIPDDGSLVFQGNVPPESQVRLMIATQESCLEATRQATAKVLETLPHPDFLLVFSSISRYILLGGSAIKELEVIKTQLGEDLPAIGIYTYGEQAPLTGAHFKGKTDFRNQTVTLLALQG